MSEEKKGFFKEFKEFIARGNVMDMAVGVVVGGAFTSIVNALVNNVIMPVIGVIIGGINFESLKIVLKEATEETAEVAICYGSFIQALVNFLIIAFVVFSVVKGINSMRRKAEEKMKKEEEAAAAAEEPEAPAEPEIPADIALLTEIRDLLKKE